MIIFYIIGGAILLLLLGLMGIYNGLVARRNRINEAWSDIEVQMKRRYDLIPNVVETIKGYAAHEKTVFENVVRARSQAMGAKNQGDRASAENMLSGTLKSLFALAESYPDLKANTNFLDLQRELSDTENKIQAARRFYNSNVRDYNIMLESFPSNIVAGFFGFKERDLFGLEEEAAKKPVAVRF